MVRPGLILLVCLAFLLAACGSPPDSAGLNEQEQLGQRLFNANCASCHALQPDTVIVGPSMAGIAGRANERVPGMGAEEYLRQSILTPDAYIIEGFQNLMPAAFGQTLSDEHLDALVAFLYTLDGNVP